MDGGVEDAEYYSVSLRAMLGASAPISTVGMRHYGYESIANADGHALSRACPSALDVSIFSLGSHRDNAPPFRS